MSSCTTGPRYCPKCGKALEFGAKLCKSCGEVLSEKKKLRTSQLFTKKPKTYKFIGFSLIIISYVYGLSSPFNLFFSLLYLIGIFYPPLLLSLLLFTIGLFLVYVNIGNQLRGLIQICLGIFIITSIFIGAIPIFVYSPYPILFIIPNIVLIVLSIICGVLTIKNNSVFSYIGFFSTIYLVSEVNSWIIGLINWIMTI